MSRLTCRVLQIFVLVLVVSSPVCAQKKLAAAEAKDHFGETAIVCGEVITTSYAETSNGQPTFMNLDKAYPDQVFTVVIWGDSRSKFGKPEENFKGKRICVDGKITAYAGKP